MHMTLLLNSESFLQLLLILGICRLTSIAQRLDTTGRLWDPAQWTARPESVVDGILSTAALCINLIPRPLWPLATIDGSPPRLVADLAVSTFSSRIRWSVIDCICLDVTDPTTRTAEQNELGPVLPLARAGRFAIRCPRGWQHLRPLITTSVYDHEYKLMRNKNLRLGICAVLESFRAVAVPHDEKKCINIKFQPYEAYIPPGRDTYRMIAWISDSRISDSSIEDPSVLTQSITLAPVSLHTSYWPWGSVYKRFVSEQDPKLEGLEHFSGIAVSLNDMKPGGDYRACVHHKTRDMDPDVIRYLYIAAEIFFSHPSSLLRPF